MQFAKTQAQENTVRVNLNKIFYEIQENFNSDKLEISIEENIILFGRPSALKRCFENIIQNGLMYGKRVFTNVQKSTNRVMIIIEDDGPGIPQDQYKNVFKPFFRLDKTGV